MPNDLTELLTQARDSFNTIDIEFRAEYDTIALDRLYKQSTPDLARQLATGAMAKLQVSDHVPATRDEERWQRQSWRVRWRKPSSWRDDVVWDAGLTAVNVVRGESSHMYAFAAGTLSTTDPDNGLFARLRSLFRPPIRRRVRGLADRLREVPMVDPSFFTNGWELSPLGQQVYLGREATHIRATKRSADAPPAFWAYIDECDLIVDKERGVLLRYAGILDGQEVCIFTARSVRFDEPIPDEIFSYKPPKAKKIVRM